MSYEDFAKHFNIFELCKYQDTFKFYSEKYAHQESGYYFVEVEVTCNSKQTFAVSQKSWRSYPAEVTVEYSNCHIMLIK
jgi:hypothetical protein